MILHVDYVTDPEASPDPIGFVLDAMAQPAAIPMLLAGFVVIGLLVLVWARLRPLEDARLRFIERAESYSEYIPWIIRLSAGLVLIGAGLSRVLFEPRIEAPSVAAYLLTGIGFLLLLGLAVRPAALVGLAAYAVSLVVHPQLVMMLDVAGALAVAGVLGPGSPSLDDLLRAAFPRGPGARAATQDVAAGRYDDVVPLLVRLGLGGAFVASGLVDLRAGARGRGQVWPDVGRAGFARDVGRRGSGRRDGAGDGRVARDHDALQRDRRVHGADAGTVCPARRPGHRPRRPSSASHRRW